MSTLRSGFCRPGIILYLAFILLSTRSIDSAPVYESDSTQVAEYDAGSNGCYYNFQRYQEGARIITNEPCLNCTCHNRMLMCYLRVCPFTKAIGQDCMVEKRPDQCCPVITCPEVPVQLLTSTTTSPLKLLNSSTSDGPPSFELGFPDTYGCNVNDRFYPDGAQLPVEANNPCELCYCIRNKTTCLMQQCTLSVAGCRPVYQPGICCPVKYNCEYEETYEIAAGTTPGLIMTTTLAPRTTPPQCHYEDKVYEDGELIYTIQPCQHCYCFHGEIVCAVQECGKPMEAHGKNCTAQPPLDGECCPTTYQCEDGFGNLTTDVSEDGGEKNIAEFINQDENKHQETFPGADNTIPEQVISDRLSITNKPLIETSLDNEVSKSENQEPTNQLFSETIEKEKYTTQQYGNDKIVKQPNEELEKTVIKSDNINVDSLKISTEIVSELPQTTIISVTMPREILPEIPEKTAEDSIEETKEEEKPITESNIVTELPTELKLSNINGELTTVRTSEELIDSELTNSFTTEKQIEELSKLTTKSSVNYDEVKTINEFDVNTTEKDRTDEMTSIRNEAKEKSSESSSPISEITTTEQSSSTKIIDPLLYTSDKEIDNVDVTTERDPNTVDYASLKTEDTLGKEHASSTDYEIPTTIISDEYNKIEKLSTPFVLDILTDFSNDKQTEKINSSIDAEFTTELIINNTNKSEEMDIIKTIESATTSSFNKYVENQENTSSMNAEDSTLKNSFYKNEYGQLEYIYNEYSTVFSTDDDKITEGLNAKTSVEISTLSNSNDKQSEETTALLSTEIPISENSENNNTNGELLNETINPVYPSTEEPVAVSKDFTVTDIITEKNNNNELSTDFNTDIYDHEKLPLEENNDALEIPEQESTEILKSERGPEHKAEDIDAVTDTGLSETDIINENKISSNIGNLQTDHPESLPSTYLPSVDVNTESNRQPSTPLYEVLPKEDSEIERYTTELSITSKTSYEKTTMDSLEEIIEYNKTEENIEAIQPNLHILEEEHNGSKMDSETILMKESSIEPISSSNLSDGTTETVVQEESTENVNLQNITSTPSEEDIITQTSILSEHQKHIPENNDASDDKSEINIIDSESTQSIEITLPSNLKDESTEVAPTDLQNNENKHKMEEDAFSLSNDDSIITDIPKIGENNKQSTNENSLLETTIEPIDRKDFTTTVNLEMNNKKLVQPLGEHHDANDLNTSNFNLEKELFKNSMENTEVSTSVASESDELSPFTEKENEYTSSPEVSINLEYNQDNLKDITNTDFNNETVSTEQNKFNNVDPESSEEYSMTNNQEIAKPVNLNDEITTTVDNTEVFTEKSDLQDNMYQNKIELAYSTEVNPITNQVPELEIKIPVLPEVRPAPGIPGEGNCLVDGQSYSNNSAIPPGNACQLSCRCVSSIVQCELIKCSPPPTDLPNCVPIYTSTDGCCPMYTCDSSSSVELEADNQMSDHHLLTSEDKIRTQEQQNPSTEELPFNLGVITNTKETNIDEQTTESAIRSESEILESNSITNNEDDKVTDSPISSIEIHTISSLIPHETTLSIFEKPSGSVDISKETFPSFIDDRINDNEESVLSTLIKINNTEEDSTFMTTESNIEAEYSNAANNNNAPLKLDSEHRLQTENYDFKESITDLKINTSNSNEIDPTLSVLEMMNVSEVIETTTQANVFIKSDNNDKEPTEIFNNTGKIETTTNDIPILLYETTVTSIKSIENKTVKNISDEILSPSGETEFTALDTLDNTTPIVEKDIEQSQDSDSKQHLPVTIGSNSIDSVDSSTRSFITENQFIQSTIASLENTINPEEMEHDNLITILPDNHSTSRPISESAGSEQEINLINNYTTIEILSEKPVEILGVTSNESYSTVFSTFVEEHSTVDSFVIEYEDNELETSTIGKDSEIILDEKPDENYAIKESNVESEPEVNVSAEEDQQSTTVPNFIETTELTIKKEDEIVTELTSATNLHDTNTEKNEFLDKKEYEDEEDKFEIDIKKAEAEEDLSLESTTTKSYDQKQELTTSHEDLNIEFETANQKTLIQSTKIKEKETEIKLNETESLTEYDKKTVAPDIESTVETESEINVTEKNELSKTSETEDKFVEAVTTIQPISNDLSTMPFNDHFSTDLESHDPIESAVDTIINKTVDEEKQEVPTIIKEKEETFDHEGSTTPESTNFDTSADKGNVELLTDHPNKGHENESTSNESTDGEQKGQYTEVTTSEVSIIDVTLVEKPNEMEENTSTLISEEPAAAFGISANEIHTMVSKDHFDYSTKATVQQEELTETSEPTNTEDDQFHVDAHQTEEPILSATQTNDEQRPIGSYFTTLHPQINKPHKRPEFPDQQTTETDDENVFPPDNADIKNPFNTDDGDADDYDDQTVYGPGTCRYGGKIYMSAQQIPRDDACDFCFCFRSDIICLQQSCPPPIPGCHEEPIGGFCCPRYECPVSMALSLNLTTTTTTTTTTTLPPHFLSHAYRGGAFRGGCQIGNKAFRVGEDIKSKSGPCMSCICGGDGKMKCEPKACSASPMLKEMIAHAAAKKRR